MKPGLAVCGAGLGFLVLMACGDPRTARAAEVLAEFDQAGPAMVRAEVLAAAAGVDRSVVASGLAEGRWTAWGRAGVLPLERDLASGIVRLVVPEASLHGRTAVVRFTDARGVGPVPVVRGAGLTSGSEVPFRYAVRVETNALLVPANPPSWNGDAAYWRVLLPGHPVLERLACPGWMVPGGVATAELVFRVGVPGVTGGRCRALLNGVDLGEAAWQGRGLSVMRWPVPEGLVMAGSNRVEWVVGGERGSVVHADQAELWVTSQGAVRGTRLVEATADGVLVLPQVAGGWSVLESGPGGWRGRVEIGERPGAGEVRWVARQGEAFWIVDPDPGWRAPSRVWGSRAGDLFEGPRAEVRVVVPEGWDGCGPGLVETFARQGHRVRVHGLGSIRDGAGYGDADPESLRDWLRGLARKGAAPEVLVLVGDGHLDVLGATGGGANLMPPVLEMGDEGFRAGDTGLGDLDGDGWPEVVVCRVPVRTEAECQAWLEKRSRWLAARGSAVGWGRVLVASDRPDAAGNFARDGDELASGVGPGWTVERALEPEVGVTGVREALLEGLGGGADLVHYLGHGGRDRMGSGYLAVSDLGGLPVVARPPVVIGMTCGIGQFALPQSEGLAEALVRLGTGGAMAVWTSEGTALSPAWRSLGQGWAMGLKAGSEATLGDLVRGAMEWHRALGGEVEAVRGLVLLGDALLPVAGSGATADLRVWAEVEGDTLWLGWTGGEGPFRVEALAGWPPERIAVVHSGPERACRMPLDGEGGRFYRVVAADAGQGLGRSGARSSRD